MTTTIASQVGPVALPEKDGSGPEQRQQTSRSSNRCDYYDSNWSFRLGWRLHGRSNILILV